MQLEVQVWVPQSPQSWVEPDEQTPSPVQEPQVQLEEQVWVPQLPQDCVAPGEHMPPPPQEPQVQLEVQIWVPQLPQPWVVPGEQMPSPVQLPQAQLEEQVWVPQLPQDWVAPGEQEPDPEQEPQEPQVQSLRQVRDSVPQLPHGLVSMSPGWQPSSVQVPQSQLAVQVCVPQSPHVCVSSMKHTLPGLSSEHSGQFCHMQVTLQPLVRVPQFPAPQSCVSVSPAKHW